MRWLKLEDRSADLGDSVVTHASTYSGSNNTQEKYFLIINAFAHFSWTSKQVAQKVKLNAVSLLATREYTLWLKYVPESLPSGKFEFLARRRCEEFVSKSQGCVTLCHNCNSSLGRVDVFEPHGASWRHCSTFPSLLLSSRILPSLH